MRNALARIAAWGVERPSVVIALAVLLTLIGAVGALSLEADRDPESLVDRDSPAFAATEDFYDRFGDEPVRILVEGDLQRLLLTENLAQLLALEGCISGKAPAGKVFGKDRPAPAACARLSEERPAQVVFGPATFLNQSVLAAKKLFDQQLRTAVQQAQQAQAQAILRARRQGLSKAEQVAAGNAAYQEVLTQLQNQAVQIGLKYGLSGVPDLTDPTYVSNVVFDQNQPGGVPKSRFNFLFPGPDSALITVRLRPDLTQAERERAITLIRDVVEDPAFRLQGGTYVVSGVPVIFDGLAQAVSDEVFVLLAVALAAMALMLALVFGPPLRLLPLAIALGAAGVTFGLLALVGGSLTMASIAVLPVLVGLAVDYAIQFHARFVEAGEGGSSPPRAAVEAAARGGPVIATAGLATVAGFAVLLLSPIPMVRAFGLLLVVGVALAFVLALTAGLATLSMTPGRAAARGRARGPGLAAGRRRPLATRASARRRAAGERTRGLARRALAVSIASPGRVLAVALVLAVGGWVAGTRTELISDIRELLPANLSELRDVDELERVTGQSGDVYVTVHSDDLTDPEVVSWMGDFEQRVLAEHGPADPEATCSSADAELCPGASISTLFVDRSPTQEQIARILGILPRYFSQAVISPDEDGSGGVALIGFGIKVMPFDEQKRLIDDIRAEIEPPGAAGPPAGVDAAVVGLPVLAADANSALEGNRYLVTIAGLVAVGLALLAVYRSAARALVPLVPIVLATGWSALVLALAGVPLNPMSATLGALVIAIATEFSVLLSARYHEERAAGNSVGEALRRAYTRTGAAVTASGLTAIAGFAVLIVSDVRMLRDFGLVTVLDLAVALAGVLIVLPAALVWAEGGFEPVAGLARRLRSRRPAGSRAVP